MSLGSREEVVFILHVNLRDLGLICSSPPTPTPPTPGAPLRLTEVLKNKDDQYQMVKKN